MWGIKQKLLVDNIDFWLLFSTILKVLYKEGRDFERERIRGATEDIIGRQGDIYLYTYEEGLNLTSNAKKQMDRCPCIQKQVVNPRPSLKQPRKKVRPRHCMML